MLKDRVVKFGDLTIAIYDFEFKGDELPSHQHDHDTVHITICVKGEVEVVTSEWTKTIKEGNIIEFYPYQMHSIIALTDNSRITNIPIKYDKS
jgi:quercetin dioxygenase-like cupin family protein